MMTIHQFSYRTGLSAHTLRFYDKKGLLVPAMRSSSGYRVYTEEQIPQALLIHSLRHADVPMAVIQHFLTVDEEQKNALLRQWRNEAETKLLSIQIAKRYLEGMDTEHTRIHLSKWESAIRMLWSQHRVPKPDKNLVYSLFDKIRSQMESFRVNISPYVYVRIKETTLTYWTIEIGFQLRDALEKEDENSLLALAFGVNSFHPHFLQSSNAPPMMNMHVFLMFSS